LAPAFASKIVERFQALWRYRGFVAGMVWREFKGRYLGSLLGSIWSILNPMAMIFIYTVIFSRMMQARLPGVDDAMGYGVFICAGLLPWTYFSELLSRCPNVFVDHASLLKKIHFPRITLPVIVFWSSTINFIIIYSLFSVFLIVTGRFPGSAIVHLIPLLVIQQAFVLGIGVFLGSLNVFFRDVSQMVGIALQFWFWLTPIVYPLDILPERVRSFVELNPMTSFVTAYQDIILKGQSPIWGNYTIYLLGSALALTAGFFVFSLLSNQLVDEL
jgi:lipopolysaccharide transport system permease protein